MAKTKLDFFELSTSEAQVAAARKKNLFSNVFLSVALEDTPSCEYILRILTKIPDLEIIREA